jgi:transaldolase/glucose-6-phosphate isomerase
MENLRSIFLGEYEDSVRNRLKNWRTFGFLSRLWDRDHRLWADDPQAEIANRLGWLDLPERMESRIEEIRLFAEDVKKNSISRVCLLGMGGSSLAAEMFMQTFGSRPEWPGMTVADSTHPEAVLDLARNLDLNRSFFLVASKSGTTLETLSLFRYFWQKMLQQTKNPGNHFAAITDKGTPLTALAAERKFKKIFSAPSDVGGRFSALSPFGLVPAALLGLDIRSLNGNAKISMRNHSPGSMEENALGLMLGAFLGDLNGERDKLTVITSASLRGFSDWLEQLLAESTGKQGKGILPIVHEPMVDPSEYGQDRLFFLLDCGKDRIEKGDSYKKDLERSGFPYIHIRLDSVLDIAGQMMTWEIAVAAAASILALNPFDQPDVNLSKELTRQAMISSKPENGGPRVSEIPETSQSHSMAEVLEEELSRMEGGGYTALQAFLNPNTENTRILQEIRLKCMKKSGSSSTLGFGPRFLHSTGQIHKGGPEKGLFLQFTDDPRDDLPVPETDYTFASLIRAQAEGDFQALCRRKRRVLRFRLKPDALSGLNSLSDVLDR